MTNLARIALAASVSVATPAIAQEERLVWIGNETPLEIALQYGLPESDHVVFGIRCDRESRLVTLSYGLNAEPGFPGPYAIDLSSIGGARVIEAKLVHLDALEMYLLEAKITLDPEMSKILTTGDTLFLMIGDGADELPLPEEGQLQPVLDACLVLE